MEKCMQRKKKTTGRWISIARERDKWLRNKCTDFHHHRETADPARASVMPNSGSANWRLTSTYPPSLYSSSVALESPRHCPYPVCRLP